MEIKSLGDKWGWVPIIEEHDSEEEEGPVMEGKAQVGGLKPPAVKVKKAELVKLVKKLETKITKLKGLNKSKNVKDDDGKADGEDGKSYKELYHIAKSDYDAVDQKRVDLLAKRTKLEEDNRDLKGQIELLEKDKVALGHDIAILDNEITHKDKALTKSEAEVLYFKNLCHGPQVSQYPSTSTLGGTSVSQRGLSPQNIASNGFVSPP